MTLKDITAESQPATQPSDLVRTAAGRGRRAPLTPEEEWRYAEKALTWYGWGSPIGLSVFVLSLTAAAFAVRWIVASL